MFTLLCAVLLLAAGCAGGPTTEDAPPTGAAETGSTAETARPTGTGSTATTAGTGATTAPLPPRCGPMDLLVHWTGGGVASKLDAAPDGGGYLAGGLGPELVLGAAPGSPVLHDSCGAAYDGLLVRYRPDGTAAWSRAARGCGLGSVAVEAGPDRVAWVTLRFDTPAVFDGGRTQDGRVGSHGLNDVTVASYTLGGDLLWVSDIGGEGIDGAMDVAVASDGSVYVVGTYRRLPITIAHGPGAITLQPADHGEFTNDDDGFLAKWNPDGTLAWAQAMLGLGDKDPATVTVAADGTVIVVGSYVEEVVLAPGTPEETRWVAISDTGVAADGFTAAFDPGGRLSWSQRWGDARMSNDVASAAVTPDGVAAIAIVGTGATFGFSAEPFPVDDFSQALVHWTSEGTVSSVRSVLSVINQGLDAVDARSDGWIAAAGSTGNALTFGAPPNQVTLTATRGSPMVLTWRPDGTEACAWPIVSDRQDNYDSAEAAEFDGHGGLWVTGSFPDHLTFVPGTPQEATLTDGGVDGYDIFLAHFRLEDPVPATPR